MNYINPLWLTPIWTVQTDFDTEFNQTLLDEMYAIAQGMATEAEPKTSLWDYNTPALIKLKSTILVHAHDLISQDIAEVNELNIGFNCNMAWANVKEPGQSIELHAHPDASFAATYYVQTQDRCGDLVVIDHTGKEINLTPSTGKIVIFPSYVLHRIESNNSNALRVSISTDITQVIDPTAPNALVLRSWCNDLLKIRKWSFNN
jgi:hypothetical protein